MLVGTQTPTMLYKVPTDHVVGVNMAFVCRFGGFYHCY